MTARTAFQAILVSISVAACGPVASAPTPEATRWLKGNLHTHSLWSDGNDYPEMVTDWYRARGYDFLAISDHNTLAEGERWTRITRDTDAMKVYERYLQRFGQEWVEERWDGDTLRVRLKTLHEYRPLLEQPGEFLIIQSEEISDSFEGRPLHMNATGIVEKIQPRGGNSVTEVLQNDINAVLEQRRRTGAPIVPHLNHPNFRWAVTVEDMLPLEGERFFEVYNGHPQVNTEGDQVRPSTDRIWDILLAHQVSEGREMMYGLGVDDSHQYWTFRPGASNPGRGWIMVRARELTTAAVVEAMERGDFYASSGVTLRDLRSSPARIAIEIEAEPGVTYTTQFIGTRTAFDRRSEPQSDAEGKPVSRRYSADIGQVLAEVRGASPSYVPRGDELYVRARIVSSRLKENGWPEGEVEMAWTQPVVIAGPRPEASR